MAGILGIGTNYERDFNTDISLERIPGWDVRTVAGSNGDIDTGDDVTIWPFVGNKWVRPDVGSIFYISSTSASDTLNTFFVTALDPDYVQDTYIVTPNGQTPVDITGTGKQLFRIIDCINISTVIQGAPHPSLGDIYIASENNHTSGIPNDAAKVQGQIELRGGISADKWRCGYTTVPKGKTAIARRVFTWLGKNKEASINWNTSLNTASALGVELELSRIQQFQNFSEVSLIDVVFPQFSDIHFTISAENNNSSAESLIQFLIVDNNVIA
ncbi:MAG: hypothetical protein CMI54_01540 [Parcubacteria group bacterium]|nr:hypothetical protein [Parcubacteria group bacterium]|tara:strand:+ start:32028 stop:32840 length:813 start_codon:yes stop_codon:yes gene_type:complete